MLREPRPHASRANVPLHQRPGLLVLCERGVCLLDCRAAVSTSMHKGTMSIKAFVGIHRPMDMPPFAAGIGLKTELSSDERRPGGSGAGA